MDLTPTITVDSSQINAEDVLEPRVFRIVGCQRGPTKQQPVEFRLEGEDKVYRPCKTMRRLLVRAWGKEGSDYAGKLVRLFRDPRVRNPSGQVVGGTRINGLSHTDQTSITVPAGQSGSQTYRIEILRDDSQQPKPTDPRATLDRILAGEKHLGPEVVAEVRAAYGAPLDDDPATWNEEMQTSYLKRLMDRAKGA